MKQHEHTDEKLDAIVDFVMGDDDIILPNDLSLKMSQKIAAWADELDHSARKMHDAIGALQNGETINAVDVYRLNTTHMHRVNDLRRASMELRNFGLVLMRTKDGICE